MSSSIGEVTLSDDQKILLPTLTSTNSVPSLLSIHIFLFFLYSDVKSLAVLYKLFPYHIYQNILMFKGKPWKVSVKSD